MVTLATPVVVAEIGWVAMGLVDTLMVGPLGPEAIGAVGIGSSLFIGVVIFAMGLLLGLDTLVSHAYGAGRARRVPPLARARHRAEPARGASDDAAARRPVAACSTRWGLDPAVLALARPYLDVLAWSVAAAPALRDVPPLPAGHMSCGR